MVVVVGVAVVMLAGFLVMRSVVGSGTDYAGEGTGSVAVRVAPGDSVSQIAKALADADVVKTAGAFVDVARADERAQSLPPGTYTLREQMSAQAALDLMLDPASRRASRLVVPEGQRVTETIAAAAKASGIPVEEFERVLAEPTSYGLPAMAEGKPEGFLFPATYDLTTDATARSILTQMTRRFDQAAKTVGPGGGCRGARPVPARRRHRGQHPGDRVRPAGLPEGRPGHLQPAGQRDARSSWTRRSTTRSASTSSTSPPSSWP